MRPIVTGERQVPLTLQPFVGFRLSFLIIEIAIAIGIDIGAREGKLSCRRILSDIGPIWRPDPDVDLDWIAPSGAHLIMS